MQTVILMDTLIINDYAKYDSFDYPTIPEELDGFKLGGSCVRSVRGNRGCIILQ